VVPGHASRGARAKRRAAMRRTVRLRNLCGAERSKRWALDGAPLDPKDYVATPKEGHDNFQDSNTFITSGGQRGPQKDILLPGTYYINPMLFKVILESAKEVKPGEVAVIVSNTGKDPGEDIRRAMANKIRTRLEQEEEQQMQIAAEKLDKVDGDKASIEDIRAELLAGDPADKRLDSGAHEAYVVPEGYRGIQFSRMVIGDGGFVISVSRNRWPSGAGSYVAPTDTVNNGTGFPGSRLSPFGNRATLVTRLLESR